MALSANSVFEVRAAGSDLNGGGFVTGAAGTDYSQQDAKNTAGADISTTDAVGDGTTTLTSATANFGTTIVGNILYLQGGTGSLAAGWYEVTARASTTSITLDRAVAAGTGITMNIGGALASPGMAGGVGLVSGNSIYIKAGTYTIASATANIATGCFSSSLTLLRLEGYQTTRGDLGTAPLLQASGIGTFVILTLSGADSAVVNVDTDGASLTSSRGMAVRGLVYRCKGSNCTNSAFMESTMAVFIRCIATGCASQPAFGSGSFVDCLSHDNTFRGFEVIAARWAVRCIADSNSTANAEGFLINGVSAGGVINCVAYNNGSYGFRVNDDVKLVQNCLAEGNANVGISVNDQDNVILINNGTYNNTSGGIGVGAGKGVMNIGAVAGSGSFFTAPVTQDFSLNNTAGAGAAARAAGFPGALSVGGTGYLDIGALQHADPTGGGLVNLLVSPLVR